MQNKDILTKIQEELNLLLSGKLDIPDVDIDLELTPEHVPGDLAMPAFSLAKLLKRNPKEVAEEIANILNDTSSVFIAQAEAAGSYVNLQLKKEVYAEVLNGVINAKDAFGKSDTNKGKKAWIEYSAPNIAKPIGVGHLRSTVIGESLARIYETTGFEVIRHNYLGDWGTQFGKLIYAYQQWGQNKELSIQELKDLYVRFHQEAEQDKRLEDKARELSKKLEEGDPELRSLWEKFRTASVDEFKKTYEKLGIEFDRWEGEAFFTDKMDEVIAEATKKRLAKPDPETGALVVDLGNTIPTFLLQRADGASLYITRDLASLKYRVNEAHPDTLLYIVGNTQELNFRQLFGLAERLGYVNPGQAKHISFGTVLNEGKKMSTREGSAIELEQLLNESIAKSKEIIQQKNQELSEDEVNQISEIIGIGAVIYNDLRQSRIKDISFDWKRMLDFESGSVAYLQYTYVRIQSILKKVESEKLKVKSKYTFEDKSEFVLARKLLFFHHTILRAQELDSPHLIPTYLEELGQLFNSFYAQVSIMDTEDRELKNSRLALISAVAQIIKNGLGLLNIRVPERM